MKTSYVFVVTRRLQDVLIKTNIFALLIRLQKTSSRCLDQDQHIRLGHTSSRRLQYVLRKRIKDVFKTSLKHLQDVLLRRQDISKTSSRHLQDVFKTFWKCLQDIFKTYYQVKPFLVTQFQDVFEMYSKRSWDVLLGRLSAGGLTRSNFTLYGQCTNFPRVVKVSQVLVFHLLYYTF